MEVFADFFMIVGFQGCTAERQGIDHCSVDHVFRNKEGVDSAVTEE
jgi:hypothetical protein